MENIQYWKKTTLIISILFIFGCNEMPVKENIEEIKKERKYEVRLSNSIGSDWYECDSIIDVNDKIIKLKNSEDTIAFIEIRVPENVVVRIYPKKQNI